jgi:hypothetical protein
MQTVSDARSNAPDQIAHAARVIGRSKQRAAIFREIYRGSKRSKTAAEVSKATGISRMRVLQEAGALANQHLLTKWRADGEMHYQRDAFYAANKGRILSLAGNPDKLKAFPTKTNPKGGQAGGVVIVRVPRHKVQVKVVTIDDLDSFKAIRRIEPGPARLAGISERQFKQGVQRILKENGEFKDWGGEKNDLYSTRIQSRGRRRRVALAFKGPATTGELTPGKMGKNGDQIQRLFEAAADIYLVQYWAPIRHTVTDQMDLIATATSIKEGREVLYGVIDGSDSGRLVAAYPREFERHPIKRAKRAKKPRKGGRRLRKSRR